MSIPGYLPPRANWAPLSPPSPTSTSVTVSKRITGPTNLPSSPAPSHSSVDAPQFLETLSLAGPTPPASVPMSAQQSQTSITDAASSALPAQPSRTANASFLDHPRNSFESQLRTVSGSKRKIEDDEVDTPSKRAKTEGAEKSAKSAYAHTQEVERSPLFRVGSQPFTVSQPHGAHNLIDLYDLGDIAASLARKDVNGEKINKLRKSYENFIKDIPGKEKVYKAETAELWDLSKWPDDDYYNTRVNGKELSAGLSGDMFNKLAKATRIDAGVLSEREDSKWKNIIDPENLSTKAEAPQASSTKKVHDASSSGFAPSQAVQEALRSSRRGTKRRYNDESFEGYGEGFLDDHAEAASPDGEDGDAGSTAKRKKRREAAGSPNFTHLSTNVMGAVSVGDSGYGGR